MATRRVLVRIRQHLFLSRRDAHRGARRERAASTVAWRPFLLGPLFAEQGWRDSPFNVYPVKGRYMWRDMQRICDALGLPLRRPDPFPQNSLLAARVALTLDGGEPRRLLARRLSAPNSPKAGRSATPRPSRPR